MTDKTIFNTAIPEDINLKTYADVEKLAALLASSRRKDREAAIRKEYAIESVKNRPVQYLHERRVPVFCVDVNTLEHITQEALKKIATFDMDTGEITCERRLVAFFTREEAEEWAPSCIYENKQKNPQRDTLFTPANTKPFRPGYNFGSGSGVRGINEDWSK